MDATELTTLPFWEDHRPVALGPPRLIEEGHRLEGRLAESEWARGAVVFASSGSTGPPKWVLLQKEALLASARMVNAHFGVTAEDVWILALPWWHVGGFGVAARAFEAGCGFAAFGESWDPTRFVESARASGASCTSLVPTQVHDLVAAGCRAPESMRVVVVGGGALALETGMAARDLGWPVVQSYGMTEAGSQIATAELGDEFRGEELPVLPGWQVTTNDEGQLRIRGEALFGGYVIDEDGGLRLSDELVDGWFRTADLVSVAGGCLSFAGRSDRTVKILGELVEVDRLERELAELGGGGEVRLLVMDEARAGGRLVPVVTGPIEEWKRAVSKINVGQPGFARLEEPVEVSEIPRTELGKPDMQALRQLVSEKAPS